MTDEGVGGTPRAIECSDEIAPDFDGNRDVYVIGIDGAGLLRLTCFPELARYPSWWWPRTD